jgi:hypothetical protein
MLHNSLSGHSTSYAIEFSCVLEEIEWRVERLQVGKQHALSVPRRRGAFLACDRRVPSVVQSPKKQCKQNVKRKIFGQLRHVNSSGNI